VRRSLRSRKRTRHAWLIVPVCHANTLFLRKRAAHQAGSAVLENSPCDSDNFPFLPALGRGDTGALTETFIRNEPETTRALHRARTIFPLCRGGFTQE